MRLIVLLFFLLYAVNLAQAGLWSNLNDAMANLVNDYNTDMLATGDSVNSSMQGEGSLGGKLNSAFDNYHTNIVTTGDHALENSKAVYKALRDIAMWLPDQLKKLWEKFVALLQGIRDKLNALNEQLGGSSEAAASKASRTRVGLGDGFVVRFEKAQDLRTKIKIYGDYWQLVEETGQKLMQEEEKNRNELLPKLQKVAAECMAIEEVLLKEVMKSEANLKLFNDFMTNSPSLALQQFRDKLEARLKASLVHSEDKEKHSKLLKSVLPQK